MARVGDRVGSHRERYRARDRATADSVEQRSVYTGVFAEIVGRIDDLYDLDCFYSPFYGAVDDVDVAIEMPRWVRGEERDWVWAWRCGREKSLEFN